jgi:predicted  nucleic acid-binding Zn-ribbon protein
MASSQPSEEVTVSVDGVTVVKRFEEDEFPVPAIAFEFRSARDESVTVQLRDAVPEGVAVEDLGFHPEYGSVYWTVGDGGITFERELEANAAYTTVYGIRATDTKDIDQFMVEPTIEAVDPPLPDGADAEAPEVDVVPGDQEAVKSAISGDGTVPGLEEAEEGEDRDTESESEGEDEAQTLDLNDPTAEPAEGDAGSREADDSEPAATEVAVVQADDGDADAGPTGEAGEAGSADRVSADADIEPAIRRAETAESTAASVDGSLVRALAEEVRQDEVPEEDVELLREALGTPDRTDGTTEARLQQLQQDIADLRAYVGALDEFLDENGTAQQVLEDARGQIDSFERQLAEFEQTVDRVETNTEEAATTAEAAEAEVETIHDDLEGVADEVGDVQDSVESVDATVDDVRGDVTDLRTDLEGASRVIADLSERTVACEAELEELGEEVHGGDTEGRLEEVESTLEDLQEWQTQIKETFGG